MLFLAEIYAGFAINFDSLLLIHLNEKHCNANVPLNI